MSIEAAFRKVSEEVGTQSVALAEEFTLTTAELSYLPDRRQAYENLAQRTGLEGVKAVCLALQQAERYGTPLATTLRVLAQENRDMRMSEAEKKAAGLPPKLTVPMIVFFLPVLFVVILGPAAIRVMALQQCTGNDQLGPAAIARRAIGDRHIGALARQHLPQIGDIGGGLIGRQVGARDLFGLGKAALQADHQSADSAARADRPAAAPRRARSVASASFRSFDSA